MGNCLHAKTISLEVDEDQYEDALDEVLDTIRTEIAINRGHKIDFRLRTTLGRSASLRTGKEERTSRRNKNMVG